MLYFRVEIKPLANEVAKLKLLMKKQRQINKDHTHNVIRRNPYKRTALEKVDYYTGSSYSGEWNYLGIEGVGIYKLKDGTTYVGEMRNGLFSGQGSLRFPNGGTLVGRWNNGELIEASYIFQDGLVYNPSDWGYCNMPDRRFHAEVVDGLKPSGNVRTANEYPEPYVWPGCFSTAEGFYRPKTKELINVKTGETIRIVNKPEEEWILRNCKRHGELPFPFNPSIYENWFPLFDPKHCGIENSDLWNSILYKTQDNKIQNQKSSSELQLNVLLMKKKDRCIFNKQRLFP